MYKPIPSVCGNTLWILQIYARQEIKDFYRRAMSQSGLHMLETGTVSFCCSRLFNNNIYHAVHPAPKKAWSVQIIWRDHHSNRTVFGELAHKTGRDPRKQHNHHGSASRPYSLQLFRGMASWTFGRQKAFHPFKGCSRLLSRYCKSAFERLYSEKGAYVHNLVMGHGVQCDCPKTPRIHLRSKSCTTPSDMRFLQYCNAILCDVITPFDDAMLHRLSKIQLSMD
jgi:hypothetical protein